MLREPPCLESLELGYQPRHAEEELHLLTYRSPRDDITLELVQACAHVSTGAREVHVVQDVQVINMCGGQDHERA